MADTNFPVDPQAKKIWEEQHPGQSYEDALQASRQDQRKLHAFQASVADGSLQQSFEATPKRKWLAVVLAVLFSFWTYAYTYKVDKVKFWAFLALSMSLSSLGLEYHVAAASLLVTLCWIYIVYNAISRSSQFYSNYPNG